MQEYDSIVIDESDDEANRQNEPIAAAYEIYEYIVDDDIHTHYSGTVAPAVNSSTNCSGEIAQPFDSGDTAFLTLISEELRQMTPSARHQFKRKVTQMLYS